VVLSHSRRLNVNTLREVQPTLANALLRVSKALEHASNHGMDMLNISTLSDQQLSMEEIAQRHRRLAEEWEALVKRVRDIPTFEDFL
jgi:replicative DNA helicase